MPCKGWGLTIKDFFVTIERQMTDKENRQADNQNDLRKAGEVLEALPSFKFRVKLETGEEILAYVSGKLRIHKIRVLPGDKVTVEMSPYDAKRGRIVYRGK